MTRYLRSLWHEARVASAPGPLRRDWLLALVVVVFAALEVVLRQDVMWPLWSVALTAGIALLLPWRRTSPGLTVFAAFGVNTLAQIIARGLDLEWTGLTAGIFMLIFPYALLRWGSGREAYAGLLLILATFLLTIVPTDIPRGEMIGGLLFLLFPAVLGASVRYREASEKRARDQVRLRERERLARELHDTVAHHVSAIAIQAQAGRATAGQRENAALDALATIETAASNTLSEMRRLVRAMREEDEDQAPSVRSLADIERLAENPSYPLSIEVTLSGGLEQLDATLLNTLYRLTQESITNAVRHARGAKRIDVTIHGDSDQISLIVRDDGDSSGKHPPPGFGLLGMMERAVILGGTLTAGPVEPRGWTVQAELPRGVRL